MEKIRIGNDISLQVSLFTKIKEPINIHSIQAFLVNDTLCKDSFFGNIRYDRFPKEPCCCEYNGTAYDICQSGYPQYYIKPNNFICRYNGFGVYPHTFETHARHRHGCSKDCVQFIKYRARVEQTQDINKVYVYFPAEDQVTCGVYNLIIVAKCYQPGYSKYDQFKTVTVCYNDVFELVPADYSGDDITDQTIIKVGISQAGGSSEGVDKYAIGGQLDKDNLTINLSDGSVTDDIDLSGMFEWYKG